MFSFSFLKKIHIMNYVSALVNIMFDCVTQMKS